MIIKVSIETEEDGRFIADATEYPGVMAYGATESEALENVRELLAKVLKDRCDNDEESPWVSP